MQKKICQFICCGLLSLSFVSIVSAAEVDNVSAAHTNVKLGLAYLKQGMYPESKKALITALSEDPKLASVWYSAAYFLEITGHEKQAEKYYRKAIDVKPHSGSAKNNYGTFLCRVGREQEGIKQFIAATHESSYLNVAGAYENAGTCALMIHNKPLAIHYFHKALDNNPSMAFSLLSLARLDHQSGNEAQAKIYFQDFKGLELGNKSPAIVQQYETYVFGSADQPKKQTQQTQQIQQTQSTQQLPQVSQQLAAPQSTKQSKQVFG
jgi:type IV pilus assembly protein PilF